MLFKRINKNTINCIITEQDLSEQGIQVEDFLNRKEEAMAFLRRVILQAAREENFSLSGDYTSMRISVLPDHSISLTLTDGVPSEVKENKEIAELIDKLRQRKQQKSQDQQQGKNTSAAGGARNSRAVSAAQQDPDRKSAGRAGRNGARQDQSISSYGCIFFTMNDVINCCRTIADVDCYHSSLYVNHDAEEYYLLLDRKGSDTDAEFEKVCLSMNEFGQSIDNEPGYLASIREHSQCVLKDDAVQQLAKL